MAGANSLVRAAAQRAVSNARAINVAVEGVPRMRVVFRLLSEEVQKEVKAAIADTTAQVTEDARNAAPVSDASDRKAKQRPGPGELRDTVRSKLSQEGFVGTVMAGYGRLQRRSGAMTLRGQARYDRLWRDRNEKQASRIVNARNSRQALAAMSLGVYVVVVEYGDPRRNKPARPFMRRALFWNRGKHHARLRAALHRSTVTAAAA